MARRRDRRSPATENLKQKKDGSDSISRKGQVGETDPDRRLFAIFVIFFIVIPVVSMLVYKVKFADRFIQAESSIRQRGIVKTDINYQEILTEHSKSLENSSDRHYDYPLLAYITPWNSKGYEAAKIFNSKFTHLS